MISIPEYKDCEKVFYYFQKISEIPHGSGNTAKIADYIVDFAKERGLEFYRDSSNNVIIKKGATAGYENRPTVIIQGHTDMVADKTEGSAIDMERDGLKLYRDGDFLRAEGTTLGGDDGVAVAYALALLDSSDIEHPAIEALFTSDEEIGLIGAGELDTSKLSGTTMINIDSDVEGVFTVGCAGGMRIDVDFPLDYVEGNGACFKVSISGFKGGHSGMEIDKGHANAIKVLCELIANISNVRIIKICGGNADNAIPRSAECYFQTSPSAAVERRTREILIPNIIHKYISAEPDMKIELSKVQNESRAFSITDSAKIIRFIYRAPSGVINMSEDVSGLVETSANVGIIKTTDTGVAICISVRSSKDIEKRQTADSIREIAESLGASVSERGEYPAWEYKKDSHLRDVMCKVFKDTYNKDAEVLIIHAGLECGIFSNKMPGLDCVSIGPDNFDIHTPEERLSISSTARVWDYLKKVLKEI